MKSAFALSQLLAFAALTTAGAASALELYRQEIHQPKAEGGGMVMKFEELRRDEKTSLVKVNYQSGSSVGSSMFIVCGFAAIARAREKPYMIKLKEWSTEQTGTLFLIGFSDSKSVAPHAYFNLQEPLPDDLGHSFLTVQEFAPLCAHMNDVKNTPKTN